MNETSASAGNAAAAASTSSTLDTVSLLTSIHLVWIAVFAVIVIVGILYGVRLKSRRVRAENRVIEHAEQAGVDTSPAGGDRLDPAAPDDRGAPVPTPAASGGAEAASGPVTQLKGLGPKVAARLAELGVTTVGQIAALDDDAAHALDAQLGPFRGRLERDRWVEQARFLAAGDRAGFEAVFGKL